jgi:hypothetical protein
MTLTPEELAIEKKKAALMMKSIELENAGKREEAHRVLCQIPLPPHLARIFKKTWGANFLIESGYDLSEAEAEFGPDWLTR